MYGTDNQTGHYVSGLDHLRQSVADILTTPLNSRVMVRGYGCSLFDLVDAPTNNEFRILVVAAVFTALERWEPRLKVIRVDVDGQPNGVFSITMTGSLSFTDIPYQQNVSLSRDQLYRH